MIFIRRKEGIALVTSLMMTLISLTIVMALMYMVTQSITRSSQNKKYHTSLDASYGGSEIVLKDILPVVLQNYSSTSLVSTLQSDFSTIGLQVVADQKCLQSKLVKSTADWPNGCSNVSNPKMSPDMSFTLQSASGNPFIVYSKIVATTQGNSDTSGLQLEGSGVAESSSLLTPKQFPYIYRVEIQGERQNNPTTQANIEVLYAY
jgi:hypothetical protein